MFKEHQPFTFRQHPKLLSKNSLERYMDSDRKVKGQKGISLYLTIIIMVILLAIVLGLAAILVGQLKTIKGMENSVIAFYAADTGIERILVDRNDPKNSPAFLSCPCSLSFCSLNNEAQYCLEVKANGEDSCAADNYCIKSVGVYKGTKRAIEITY